jgi:DNA modification methylase
MDYILIGADARRLPLADRSVHCVVTSPPYYGLRDYVHAHQIGLEPTPAAYVAEMVRVFREVRRVLRDDGTLWLNIGDSYAANGVSGLNEGFRARDDYGHGGGVKPADGGRSKHSRTVPPGLKSKDLLGIPWLLAFALRDDGWYLRSEVIWGKRSPMPESVRDRPTRAHEQVFLLTKSARYFYDIEAEKQPAAAATRDEPRVGTARHRDYDGAAARFGDGVSASRRMATNAVGDGSSANLRTVWMLSSEPYAGAHFATMPTALATRCIRLGTSERGVCPACGAPWARVVEKDRVPTRPGIDSKVFIDPASSPYKQHSGTIIGNRDPKRHTTVSRTAGWGPTCGCGLAETVPATVFDPFVGSGTTVLAAKRLGRRGIGTDASMGYLRDHARVRVRDVRAEDRAPEPLPGQRGLFDDLGESA